MWSSKLHRLCIFPSIHSPIVPHHSLRAGFLLFCRLACPLTAAEIWFVKMVRRKELCTKPGCLNPEPLVVTYREETIDLHLCEISPFIVHLQKIQNPAQDVCKASLMSCLISPNRGTSEGGVLSKETEQRIASEGYLSCNSNRKPVRIRNVVRSGRSRGGWMSTS